jgi:thiol-disulfide isomerase/thioredoxin
MFKNQKITKFLFFFFCFSIFSSISQTNEDVPLNNMAINEIPKPISSLIFEDFLGNEINLKDYHGKLVIINFWATWCAPCKKEMPSLDNLNKDSNFKNLKVFPVNVGKDNLNLVNEFKLRGVPTTILINKKGEEFARIIGEVNFQDKKFSKWLLKYD